MAGLLGRALRGIGEGMQVYGKAKLEDQRQERLNEVQKEMQKMRQDFQAKETDDQQAFTSKETDDSQAFTASQTANSQAFTSTQNELSRKSTAEQNELNRKSRESEGQANRNATMIENTFDREARLEAAKAEAKGNAGTASKKVKFRDIDDDGNITLTYEDGTQRGYDKEGDFYYDLGKSKPTISEEDRDLAAQWGREFADENANIDALDSTDFPVTKDEDKFARLAGQLLVNAMAQGPEAEQEFRTKAAGKDGVAFIENYAKQSPEIVESVTGKNPTPKSTPEPKSTGPELQKAFDKFKTTDKRVVAQQILNAPNVPKSVKDEARRFLESN